ncbi:MAG: hypothetical protein ACE5JL_11710 [Dehalococcoidia bacterium]
MRTMAVKGTIAYFDQALQEILEATTDKPQAPDVEKVNALSVERMVRQCYALLRQGLEHKVKLEPHLYSKERMERVLQEFEASIPDIQDAISKRVADSVSELIRQEVRRVLQDAMSDLQDAVIEPASEEERGEVASAAGTGAESGERSPGKEETPKEQADQRPTGQEVYPTIDETERQPADRLSGETGAPEEGDEAAHDLIFEGHVKVGVDTHGSPKQMVRFLNQVTAHPQMGMLQMVGNYRDATVWLALRRPVPLKDLLLEMDNVSEVRVCRPRGSGDTEHVLEVVLGGLPEVPTLP